MEVSMRRVLYLLLEVSAGVVFVACGTDSNVVTGMRSDGVTIVCTDGEFYYTCTPEAPGGTNTSGGDGTVTPPGGSGSGSGSGSGTGSGGGDGSGRGSGRGSRRGRGGGGGCGRRGRRGG